MSLWSLLRRRDRAGPGLPAAPGGTGPEPQPPPATEAGTLFQRCSAVFGEVHGLADRPRVTEYAGVVLVDNALYDERRQLVPDSAFFRGVPHMHTRDAPHTHHVPARVPDRLPPGRYFWIGPFHLHFGHFTISTLSRLWALADLDARPFTFLYVGRSTPSDLFGIEFVREAFTALGIAEAQLRQVQGPLFIPAVTVAEPALVENYGASRAYPDMLGRIRQALAPGDWPVDATPVYVTKEHVHRGVRGIANEHEVTAILAREGVAVASPETLPFRDQIAFWCGRRSFAGFASSAFHLAAFAGGRRLCTVSHDDMASCNQVMLDALTGTRHLYLHAGAQLVSLGPSELFSDVVRIIDPALFARDMLRIMERLGNLPGQEMAPEPRSLWPDAVSYEPFGMELARAGRVSRSLDYGIDAADDRTAAGVPGGRLSGDYQTGTPCEPRPWWQVELPGLSYVYEVRIHNRWEAPPVQDRLACFVLSASRDGTDWFTLHVHAGAAPGAEPFRWRAPATTLARFVRVSGTTWLHMGQVEVFGAAAALPSSAP